MFNELIPLKRTEVTLLHNSSNKMLKKILPLKPIALKFCFLFNTGEDTHAHMNA